MRFDLLSRRRNLIHSRSLAPPAGPSSLQCPQLRRLTQFSGPQMCELEPLRIRAAVRPVRSGASSADPKKRDARTYFATSMAGRMSGGEEANEPSAVVGKGKLSTW